MTDECSLDAARGVIIQEDKAAIAADTGSPRGIWPRIEQRNDLV